MTKKPAIRVLPSELIKKPHDDTCHNGADVEISLYARSLHEAAKVLIEKLDRKDTLKAAWDVGPIILLYRQAIELHMKAVVDAGGDLLPSPTDHLTLAKTHSLRWLAQIVGQIIKAVQWESEFKCEGISSIAEFSAMVAELEAIEPVSAAIHADKSKRTPGEVPPSLRKSRVLEFVPRLDGLLDLLAATADGLAATADLMEIGAGRGGTEPRIQ